MSCQWGSNPPRSTKIFQKILKNLLTNTYTYDIISIPNEREVNKNQMSKNVLDLRKKYYLILDCETATLPHANDFPPLVKKKICIAKPLIYDIGWQIVDRHNNICIKRSFLVTEIFSVPSVFNTAYYAHKRPIYLEKLRNGEITLDCWENIVKLLINDLNYTESVGAYNSMFDFKKAIGFTDEYMSHLYGTDYTEWETKQNEYIDYIASGGASGGLPSFNPDAFEFRANQYPLFDIWGLCCKYLLNNDEFRQTCKDNEWFTASGKYYSTTAETAYRYLFDNAEFEEKHTAIEDVEIESEIFHKILEKTKNKFDMGIIYFPFKMIGEVPPNEIGD